MILAVVLFLFKAKGLLKASGGSYVTIAGGNSLELETSPGVFLIKFGPRK